jgi:hypothetical protein
MPATFFFAPSRAPQITRAHKKIGHHDRHLLQWPRAKMARFASENCMAKK